MEDRQDANALDPCDLVMKGGITSGVVYPMAVAELAATHRFRNVGGASVGALAAALAAAAEYARGVPGAGFPKLVELAQELASPRFITSLFQPAPGARAIYRILLEGMTRRELRLPPRGGALRLPKLPRMLAVAIARQPWLPVLAAAGAYATFRWAYDDGAQAVAVLVLIALAMTLVAALVPLLLLLRTLRRNGFGMCTGMASPRRLAMRPRGPKPEALTEWLHRKVQECAGRRPDEPPLTFGELAERGITLQLVTTDLSYSRPVLIPFQEDNPYLFDPDELGRLFPTVVRTHLAREEVSTPVEVALLDGTTRSLRQVPGRAMPIVVGARLSESFPFLLSAVRLYTANPLLPHGVGEHWLSDGGIASNFPIHFFDSWFPAQPTFGLDLEPFPDRALQTLPRNSVWMPSHPKDAIPPRWAAVDGPFGFLRQIFDAARNWRDTMQMELPGFRERVCHIRLAEDEGGLNLNMPPEVIRSLLDRGSEAGREIRRTFNWDEHRFARYLTFMQMMQVNLRMVGDDRRYPSFSARLRAGDVAGFDYADCHPDTWYEPADEATNALLALAKRWQDSPGFSIGCEPEPQPVMRVTPRV